MNIELNDVDEKYKLKVYFLLPLFLSVYILLFFRPFVISRYIITSSRLLRSLANRIRTQTRKGKAKKKRERSE